MKPELASAPLPIGGVIDSAFRLYRSTYSQCWYLTLWAVIPGIAFSFAYARAITTNSTDTLAQMQDLYLSAFGAISYLLAVVGQILANGALIVTEKSLAEGKPITAGAALAAAVRRLPAMIGAAFLAVLILMGGLCLLIIPGIYFYGKLLLCQTAIFADQEGPLSAISTSWRLTNGRWWRTVAILTVSIILIYVVAAAVGLILGAVLVFVPVSTAIRLFLTQAAVQVGYIVILPLFTAVFLAIYNDCKLRSGGGDLAARAAAVG